MYLIGKIFCIFHKNASKLVICFIVSLNAIIQAVIPLIVMCKTVNYATRSSLN